MRVEALRIYLYPHHHILMEEEVSVLAAIQTVGLRSMQECHSDAANLHQVQPPKYRLQEYSAYQRS
jgi:hypothetical protein